MSCATERRRVSRWGKVAVGLVILALLAFTTVRTSPIHSGHEPGCSLSSLHPKQRHFRTSTLSWTEPVLLQTAAIPVMPGEALPAESLNLPRECFFARCSDLPPPAA